MSPWTRSAARYNRLGRISGVPPSAPMRLAATRRGEDRQRSMSLRISGLRSAGRSTGRSRIPEEYLALRIPARTELARPKER